MQSRTCIGFGDRGRQATEQPVPWFAQRDAFEPDGTVAPHRHRVAATGTEGSGLNGPLDAIDDCWLGKHRRFSIYGYGSSRMLTHHALVFNTGRVVSLADDRYWAASDVARSPPRPRGRPRSGATHRRILEATRELLTEVSFGDLRIEHVATRAGVGKATIYRRWASKEELALELLSWLASPHIAIEATGNTREEMLAAVVNSMLAVTETPFGTVIRSLLSQIATNPALGDRFRATVVAARRDEVARVI